MATEVHDYTDDLAAAEVAFRRIIQRIGMDAHGDDWLSSFGVSQRTLEKWKQTKEREEARRGGGLAEDRLIYFSSFGDLKEIVLSNWPAFEPVFDVRETTSVYLSKLHELRNPDAHRRALTDAEKGLATGMAAELRTKITRYLAHRDTPDEFFPRIDLMRDSLGNSFGASKRPVVRVGDRIEFYAEGWDPDGAALQWRWTVSPRNDQTVQDWSINSRFIWHVQPNQVANPTWVNLDMRGPRSLHAEGARDAGWSMAYTVLPDR